MARFLIDEDLPRSLARELTEVGHDAVDVRDVGLRGAPDDRIYSWALKEGRALVTADIGLANAFRYEPRAGTVLARFPSSTAAAELSRAIARALADIRGAELSDATIVVEPGRLRIRRRR